MSPAAHLRGLALLIALASAGPASTLTAEPAALRTLERAWAAYVSFVVDPVKAWIEALRR